MSSYRPKPLGAIWDRFQNDDDVSPPTSPPIPGGGYEVSPLTSPAQGITSGIVSPVSPEIKTQLGPAIQIVPPKPSPANYNVNEKPDSSVERDEHHLHEGVAEEIIREQKIKREERELVAESAKNCLVTELKTEDDPQPFDELTPAQKKRALKPAIQFKPKDESRNGRQKSQSESPIKDIDTTLDGISYDGLHFYQYGEVIRLLDIPRGVPLLSALTLTMKHNKYDGLVMEYCKKTGKTPFESLPADDARSTLARDVSSPQSAFSVKTEDAETMLPDVVARYNALSSLKKGHLAGDGDWEDEHETLLNDLSTEMEALEAKKRKHQLERTNKTYAESPTSSRGSIPTSEKLEGAEQEYVALIRSKFEDPGIWNDIKEENLASAARKFERLNARRNEYKAMRTNPQPQTPKNGGSSPRIPPLSLGRAYRKTISSGSSSPGSFILENIGPKKSLKSSKPDELLASQAEELEQIQHELSSLGDMYDNLEAQMVTGHESGNSSKDSIHKNVNARAALQSRADELANKSNVILNSVSADARVKWKKIMWHRMVDVLYAEQDILESIKKESEQHRSGALFTLDHQGKLEAVYRELDVIGDYEPTIENDASPETSPQIPLVPHFGPIRTEGDLSPTKEELTPHALNIVKKWQATEDPGVKKKDTAHDNRTPSGSDRKKLNKNRKKKGKGKEEDKDENHGLQRKETSEPSPPDDLRSGSETSSGEGDEDSDPKLMQARLRSLFAPLPKQPSSAITTTVDPSHYVREGQPDPLREGHRETGPEQPPAASAQQKSKQELSYTGAPKPQLSRSYDCASDSDTEGQDGNHFVPAPIHPSVNLINHVPGSYILIPGQNPPAQGDPFRRRMTDLYLLRQRQMEATSKGKTDNLALQGDLMSTPSILDTKPLSKAAKRLSKFFGDSVKAGSDEYLIPQREWNDLLSTLTIYQTASALASGKYFAAEDRLTADASNAKSKDEVQAAAAEWKVATRRLKETDEKVERMADAARLRPEIIDTIFNSLVSSLGRPMNNTRWHEAWRIVKRMKEKAELEDDKQRYGLMQGRICFWSGVVTWNCNTTANYTLPAAFKDFERAEAFGVIDDGSVEGKYLHTYTELCMAGTGPVEEKDLPVICEENV